MLNRVHFAPANEDGEMIDQQAPFDYQKWTHEMRREDAQRVHDKERRTFDELLGRLLG